MNVAIPADLEPFVQSAIESGSYHSPAEVVGDALRLLQRRQQLQRDVSAGVAQLERGQYTEYDEDSLPRFLEDVSDAQRQQFPREDGTS